MDSFIDHDREDNMAAALFAHATSPLNCILNMCSKKILTLQVKVMMAWTAL